MCLVLGSQLMPHTAPRPVRGKGAPASTARLEALIEQATVDCHDESEQMMGWFTMIQDHLELPFDTSVLEATARVERLELSARDEIVAICKRGKSQQAIPILELPLPTPGPDGAEWIAAYRHWCTRL